ncbi:uncharacterized protein LOC133105620 [Conger conger]|uniref:uncharacterized protein LOC133105620 n=1 Tax=Conger conger TaxID=82655 RepID=UPI002A5AE7F0|nr:uncharacterized protein LOC133105620 [Conger conger]
MVRRCVFGCPPPQTLFPFPKNPWLRSQWLNFTHFEESGISESSQLCARHFTEDNFVNISQHKMGFAAHLSLTDTAIPSIYTVGQQSSSTKPSTRDVGCQYEAPKMKVASTQVGVCAPNKPRRRSKAIQVRPRGTSISCSTEDLGLCPSPPFASNPVKKPRFECSPASSLSQLDDSRDSTFPEASVMADGSHSNFQPPSNTAKYLVYEDNLMDLFKACRMCLQTCTIEKYVTGTFLSIIQTCHHCLHKGHWNSQPFIGKIPADNLQLSSTVALSGASYFNAHEQTPPSPDSVLTCTVKCEPSDEEDFHEDIQAPLSPR